MGGSRKVYLAGPIEGESWEAATAWRKHAETVLARAGITAYSPLRAEEELSGEKSLKNEYEEFHHSSAIGLTTRNRWDVRTADLMIVNVLGAQKVSRGTCVEVGWADAWRTPIVLVERPGGLHDHPMIRVCSGFIVPDIETACEVAIRFLNP